MLCIVWYIFFSDFIVDVLMFKKIFFWILPNSKKVCGTPVPTEYGSTVKNLTLTFWPKLFSWLPYMYRTECDIPVPGILLLFGWYRYRYRKKLVPEKSTGTGTGKILSRKKVPVPVPKNLVPEKSTGTGIGKNWSRYRKIPGNSRSNLGH